MYLYNMIDYISEWNFAFMERIDCTKSIFDAIERDEIMGMSKVRGKDRIFQWKMQFNKSNTNFRLKTGNVMKNYFMAIVNWNM